MLFVYIKTCTLSCSDGSHCNLNLYNLFLQDGLYRRKEEKPNPFYVKSKNIF